MFGSGLAITVAPLTATAMESAPSEHAGVASAVNNDVARVASLVAVAFLPWLAGLTGMSYLHPHELSSGFRAAVLMASGLCAAGGALGAVAIRNPQVRPAPRLAAVETTPEMRLADECLHCGIDAPPLARRSMRDVAVSACWDLDHSTQAWTSITGLPSGSVIAANVGVSGRSKGSATTVPPSSATFARDSTKVADLDVERHPASTALTKMACGAGLRAADASRDLHDRPGAYVPVEECTVEGTLAVRIERLYLPVHDGSRPILCHCRLLPARLPASGDLDWWSVRGRNSGRGNLVRCQ